ncbi:defensin, isoforms B and C-like [Coccinella septempunctata]|uniref:defensin, isoforms B and C-like n=1 Tax=Coccinella septempunctata TaxID=41139 RepID=UPI001D0770D8|nr:defensin, isoforms B and C-like [Coccinella septempunctata]
MRYISGLFVFLLALAAIEADQIVELRDQDVQHYRVRRFTCDVLSAQFMGFKINHAACGLHCLGLLKRGGYCNSRAICVCRNFLF